MTRPGNGAGGGPPGIRERLCDDDPSRLAHRPGLSPHPETGDGGARWLRLRIGGLGVPPFLPSDGPAALPSPGARLVGWLIGYPETRPWLGDMAAAELCALHRGIAMRGRRITRAQ